MSGWVGRTAREIAAAVRAGTADPREVVQEHLDRIRRFNDELGAFQLVREERALAEAATLAERPELAELPLAGVPIAIKDNVPVAGEPMRIGSAATSAEPSAADHEVVRRLRAAGAIVVGLTAVPELCIFGATESVYGVAHNPWDLGRTPGGSSGGSAAAVAAGLVPLAHGNDGMGSIRIPSADCGLFGLKPGQGLVPAGIGASSWFDMAENGPLATTVGDAADALAAMAGEPSLAEVASPGTLRVAVSTRSPVMGVPVDRHFAAAARATGELLAGAGHEVASADPPYPLALGPLAIARWTAGADDDAALTDRSRLERRTRVHARFGRAARRLGLVRAQTRTGFRARLAPFFERYDVLVTPGLARTPIEARRWADDGWLRTIVANVRYAPFGAPWNIAGWPAAVLPAGVHPDGLPLSVQLVAPLGQEARLLAVAGQLEELRPWQRLAPAYAGS